MSDHHNPAVAPVVLPQLILATDPMCSWCWGLWPHHRLLMERFEGLVEFELLLCGIQVGEGFTPPDDAAREQIEAIWAEVRRVTGQPVRGQLPTDPAFFYHSELACRALNSVRLLEGAVPFDFLEQLHIAFYVEGVNLASPDELAAQAELRGHPREVFLEVFRSDAVKEETRAQFLRGQQLCGGVMPTLIGERGGEVQVLSAGFAELDELLPRIERWLYLTPGAAEVH